jgi:hypothetical protein
MTRLIYLTTFLYFTQIFQITAQCDSINLLPNPSFEVRDTSWSGDGQAMHWFKNDGGELIEDADAKEGSLVWEFHMGQLSPSEYINVTPNTRYQFTVWLKGNENSFIQGIDIQYLTRWEYSTCSLVDSVGNWKKASCLFTTGPNDYKLIPIVGSDDLRMDEVGLYACETTGFQEQETLSSFSVNPNPAYDIIQLSGDNLVGKTVMVYSTLGKLVYSEKIVENHSISVHDFTNGLYFIQIGKTTRKLMIGN